MKKLTLTLAFAIFASASLLASPALAQDASEKLMRNFVHPRMLMRHQAELGLTDTQKSAIKNYVKAAQSKSVDVQFELEQQMQKLQDLVGQDEVDKSAAVTQARKVMSLENEMKAIQLGLMIDVKNVLKPAQIEKIKQFRKEQQAKKMRLRGR